MKNENERVIVSSENLSTEVSGSDLNMDSDLLIREMRNSRPALTAAIRTFCDIHGSSPRDVRLRLLVNKNEAGTTSAVHAAIYQPKDTNLSDDSGNAVKFAIKRVQTAWAELPDVVKTLNLKAENKQGGQNSITVTSGNGDDSPTAIQVDNPDTEKLLNNVRSQAKTKNVMISIGGYDRDPIILHRPESPSRDEKIVTELAGTIVSWDKEKKCFKILDVNLKKHVIEYSEKDDSNVITCIYKNTDHKFCLNPISQKVGGKTIIKGFFLLEISRL